MEKYIKVQKLKQGQPQYKTNVMEGEEHPMECETFIYELVHIGRMATDKMKSAEEHFRDHTNEARQFTPEEQQVIREFTEAPASDWAIANSFDGLYAHVTQDPARWETVIRFAVYLTPEHHTFWKLKYSGIN